MQPDDSQEPSSASPSSPAKQPAWYAGATRGQWLALAAALLGWAFDGFEQGIFPLVGRPALVELLDLSEDARVAASSKGAEQEQAQKRVDAAVGQWMGGITAAFLLGAALGGWLFGWLGDRVGRVRAMALAVLTYAVFTGLCGLARGPWQLAGLRLLSALGMGGEWALGVALVMESWPARARPMLAGLIGAAANVGFILTAVPVMLVEGAGSRIDAGGWRLVLGICAFPALLTFFLRLFVPESERWLEVVKTGPRARLIDVFAPALRLRTLIGTTVASIALIGTWGSIQWIPLWVKQMTGEQRMVNYAQMCSGLGAVMGTISAALLAQRVGRRVAYFTLCLGSLLICAYLFRVHFQVHPGVDGLFLVVVLLTGAFTASFYGWLPLYLPELFPTRVRATGQGFSYNFGRIIAAGGALGMGALMSDVFHGSYPQAGATVSLIYLVGMVLVWFIPETKGQPLPE